MMKKGFICLRLKQDHFGYDDELTNYSEIVLFRCSWLLTVNHWPLPWFNQARRSKAFNFSPKGRLGERVVWCWMFTLNRLRVPGGGNQEYRRLWLKFLIIVETISESLWQWNSFISNCCDLYYGPPAMALKKLGPYCNVIFTVMNLIIHAMREEKNFNTWHFNTWGTIF